MNPQIEQSLNRIAAGARDSVEAVIHGARQGGHRAAVRIADGKKPLQTASGVGLKLSAVSHRTTDRVLKQNTRLAAHQLDAIASRFESAATATCLRDLVRKQIALTPEQFARLGQDAREALSIVAAGGSEAREVIRGALRELRATRRPARKPAARKAAATRTRTSAAKTTRKAAPKTTRKAAAKTTARKVARKTAKSS